MPPLPRVSGREVVRALERAGWDVHRIRGSHLLMRGPNGRRTTVPVHGNQTLPLGTLDGIIEDAGTSVEEFFGLLRGGGTVTRFQFTVVLEPDREEPHRYNVRVPALQGCRTYGESIEDALANAREAIAVYVESLLADGEPVPVEINPTIATSIVVTTEAAA